MRYLSENEAMQMSGIGQVGAVVEGADGMLYEWVEGIDGLGNPVGFWKKPAALGRARSCKELSHLRKKSHPSFPAARPLSPRQHPSCSKRELPDTVGSALSIRRRMARCIRCRA